MCPTLAEGNIPPVWASLLRGEGGRPPLPFMALVRNLRNLLMMGLPHMGGSWVWDFVWIVRNSVVEY